MNGNPAAANQLGHFPVGLGPEQPDFLLDPRRLQGCFDPQFLAFQTYRFHRAARQAYRSDKIIYFNYLMREFLKELDKHWPDSRELRHSMDVAEIAAESVKLFEKTAQERRRSKSRK